MNDLHEAAYQKLQNSFGNKVLRNMVGGAIKEVQEHNGRLNMLVELRFKDHSAFAYYYSIPMKDIKWEE